ncbi:MAG: alpha/beta hydrolase [Verrucomicrobia bacterium]|nr:alpha/beta hydrolase [Verrucomicrobiota bacterium]
MNSSPPTRSFVFRFLRRLLAALGLLALTPLAIFTSCQSKLIYFPRPYPEGVPARWTAETKGKPIGYSTSQGRQRAWLLGNRENPERLWVVCGGNGTLALEWSPWLRAHAPGKDAWLLVDFPGYGDCEGRPSPGHIRESFNAVLPAATKELGWSLPADSGKLRFFGHSLGAAAVLIAASDHHIQKGVLLAPFTSTMDMAREVVGLPVGFLVWHRFDNRARLAEIAARSDARVIILHGTDDEVIPVAMGRDLAAGQPNIATLREIPGGRHNTVQETAQPELTRALEDVRK